MMNQTEGVIYSGYCETINKWLHEMLTFTKELSALRCHKIHNIIYMMSNGIDNKVNRILIVYGSNNSRANG